MRFHYKVVETRTTYHLRGSVVDDEGPTRQYERSFHTSDLHQGAPYATSRTFVTGLGVTASPGSISYLAVLAGELSELSGGFVDQHAFGDQRLGLESSAVELYIPSYDAVPEWPRYRTALIGIGLRASDGANISNLAVRHVHDPVTDSTLDLFEWVHDWHPEMTALTDYEKLTTVPEGWLCNGFMLSAGSGDMSRCRADWGRFVPGLEVQVVGTLAGPGPAGSILVSGERIGPGAPPAAWTIDPKNPRAADLNAKVRSALERGTRMRVDGILWDGETTAELVGIGKA